MTCFICTELDIWRSSKMIQWFLSFWSAPPSRSIKLYCYVIFTFALSYTFQEATERDDFFYTLACPILSASEIIWFLKRQDFITIGIKKITDIIFVQHSPLKTIYQLSWLLNFFCNFSWFGSFLPIFFHFILVEFTRKCRLGRMLLEDQPRKSVKSVKLCIKIITIRWTSKVITRQHCHKYIQVAQYSTLLIDSVLFEMLLLVSLNLLNK